MEKIATSVCVLLRQKIKPYFIDDNVKFSAIHASKFKKLRIAFLKFILC